MFSDGVGGIIINSIRSQNRDEMRQHNERWKLASFWMFPPSVTLTREIQTSGSRSRYCVHWSLFIFLSCIVCTIRSPPDYSLYVRWLTVTYLQWCEIRWGKATASHLHCSEDPTMSKSVKGVLRRKKTSFNGMAFVFNVPICFGGVKNVRWRSSPKIYPRVSMDQMMLSMLLWI